MDIAVELEINGLPDAPEDGQWLWTKEDTARSRWYKLFLQTHNFETWEYVGGTTDNDFCNVARSLIRKYREHKRLELLVHGDVRLIPVNKGGQIRP